MKTTKLKAMEELKQNETKDTQVARLSSLYFKGRAGLKKLRENLIATYIIDIYQMGCHNFQEGQEHEKRTVQLL